MIASEDNDFIKILIGVRRCGKSTLLELFTRIRESKTFDSLKDNYPRYIITFDEMAYIFDNCTHLNLFEFLKIV